MTPKELIDAFEVLAEAPSGVARLRSLILALAAQGRLVSQRRQDEPGTELLGRIAVEKARQIREGVAPKPRALSAEEKVSLPFELPATWTTALLDDVAVYIQRGKSPKYDDSSEIRVVSQKCVQWSGFDISRARGIKPASLSAYGPERFLRAGDLLWNSTGTGTVGRVNVYPAEDDAGRVVADSHVTVIRVALMHARFLYYWLAGPVVQGAIDEMTSGTTKQQELNLTTVRQQPVPVPPLPEQERIVERVDELMALLDRLEAAQHSRESTRQSLRDAALSALRNADMLEAVRSAWSRVGNKMEDLLFRPSDVPVVRQSILDLAVRGRLLPQDASDEPGKQLVNRIAAEKAKLESSNKIKKQKPTPPIKPDELPFSLPPSWEWVRLGTVVTGMFYGSSQKSARSGKVPVLRMGNLQQGEIDWTDLKYSSDKEEIEKYQLPPNSLLFNRTNSPELVGKTSIYRGDRPAIYAGYLIRIGLPDDFSPDFLNFVLASSYARRWCWDIKTDGISQSNISASKLALFLTPVPPIEEQLRIVEGVRRLMRTCDDLETGLETVHGAHAAFASSAVASLS